MVIPPPNSRPGGFLVFRPGCLGLLFTIGLLWGGGQELFTALKNRQPVTLSVKDYLSQRPSGEWVHLTQARCSLLECATSGIGGSISELYIPVRDAADTKTSPVKILLKTRDEKLIHMMENMRSQAKDQATAIQFMVKNAALMAGPKEVSGVVEFGINSDSKKRDKLAKLKMNLGPDFVVIHDGEAPSLGMGIGLFSGGLLLGMFMVRRVAASKVPPPAPPNLPAREFGSPPPLPPK